MARDWDLSELDRKALQALLRRVDRELHKRAVDASSAGRDWRPGKPRAPTRRTP